MATAPASAPTTKTPASTDEEPSTTEKGWEKRKEELTAERDMFAAQLVEARSEVGRLYLALRQVEAAGIDLGDII